MRKKTLGITTILILFFVATDKAFAIEDFSVPIDHLRVYADPNLNSQIIATLSKGQKVKAGSNPAQGFKKVLIKGKNGKNTIGYVALTDLSNKISRHKKSGERAFGSGLHNHYSMGLNLGFNYQTQGGKTLTDSGGDSATVGRLSGANVRAGAFFDMPFNSHFNGEFFIDYKPSNNTGTASPGGTVTQTSDVILTKSTVALGGIARFYADDKSDWWYGPGLELDHVTSSTLQVGSNAASNYSGSDAFQLFAATGYDFVGGKDFFIVPNFRLGATVSSPLILEFDMIISGAYRF